MIIRRVSLALALAVSGLGWGLARSAVADDAPPRVVRMAGELATPAEGVPTRFVIDAVLTPGDARFHSTIEGWFAGVPAGPDAPPAAHGEISGDCVQSRCALSADLDEGKLALTADLAGPEAPSTGRFAFTDQEDKTGEGEVAFTPLHGPVEGVGELAAPDAVTSGELAELLLWNGQATGFGGDGKGPPDGFLRDSLADWQASNQRAPTGLIAAADLEALRAQTLATRKAAGWTPIGDAAHGWSAGYPAALLPQATEAGAEHRFASADGKAVLVVAVDPPLDEAAMDAFVDKATEHTPDRDSLSYTRSNGDMEIGYTEKGVEVRAAYHNREGGFARLEFRYPAAQAEKYAPFDSVLPRSLVVTDDLKAR